MHETVERSMRPSGARATGQFDVRARLLRRPLLVAVALVVIICAFSLRYFVPVSVERAVAQVTSMPAMMTGPGLIEAKVTMTASGRVQARIVRIAVEEGQSVGLNDLVAELDLPDVKAQLRQARADLEAARAAVVEAERGLSNASAVLTNARSDYERKSELFKRGVSTQAQVDLSRASFEQAQAQRQQAEAAIERATAQRSSAEAAVSVVEARLADGIVRAPLAGIVISRERSVGDILVPGQPILQIVDPASIIVSARFDESAMGAIEPGQSVTVRFVSTGATAYLGRIVRIGRSVDTVTREFRADVALDQLPAHWAIGQRASVSVTTLNQREVTAIPEEYLARRDGRSGVWVENRFGRAVWRAVQVGQSHNGLIEVTQALAAGDVVVKGATLFRYVRLST